MFPSLLALWTLAAVSPNATTHQEISLNGDWEHQVVEQLAAPPTSGAWSPCRVPRTLRGYDYQRAWFRRSFSVPSEMRGKRIKIQFDGVKYDSRIYVNGKHVGGCANGYDPFEVDVTDVVRFDRPNELAVGCHDWTATFAPGERIDFSEKPAWQRARRFVRDRVIAPLGGRYDRYGPWGDVRLVSHPAVYVKDLFLKTSVRQKEIVVEYTIANESPREAAIALNATVEDQGKDVFSFEPVRLQVPAGKTARTTVRRAWAAPRLWSHVDPHLYHLRTELVSCDAKPEENKRERLAIRKTRFGFREFWVEGHRFYLNGTPINLLASSWWPTYDDRLTREEIRQRWESLKQCGCVAFRTHTQPWRRKHYDVADEVGLLMIVEGAMWHDPYCYRYAGPAYWENFARHLKSMVARDKNRPSVVMWSLENEAYGGGKKKEADAFHGLARMGRLMKQWDPTRPIYCESDADPGGVFDVIGCHYPHEYPQHTCWPNEAYWLKKGTTVLAGHGRREFTWEKKKPLYIGEFLWVPAGTPAPNTAFFGDEAYVDPRRRAKMAKAECWKMQILGYRHAEVAGISPWTLNADFSPDNPLYQAHQYAFQPIAAYCHEYDSRFYSGETVTRSVEVFNDVMEPSELKLDWTLSRGNRVLRHGAKEFAFGPAEHEMFDIPLPMPEVAEKTSLAWRLTISRDGRRVFEDTHHYTVFPKFRLPRISASVGLFDPKGTTAKQLEMGGLAYQKVSSLTRLDKTPRILIIGAGAFKLESLDARHAPVVGASGSAQAVLCDFVNRGGRLLVLEQETYPSRWFPVELSTDNATMAFPFRPSHPALQGIGREDLKYWRGDHLVASRPPRRPTSGGGTALVVAGTRRGIDNAPLLEQTSGRGTAVFSQMLLGQKASTAPIAGKLLGNLLQYLDRFRPTPCKTALVGGSPAYRAHLHTLGLRFDDLSGKLDRTDLTPYSLVLCRGKLESPEKLRALLDRGGHVLAHRVETSSLGPLSRLVGLETFWTPYHGAVTRAEGDGPLLENLAREDLFWFDKHLGPSWAPHARAKEMADGLVLLSKPLDAMPVESHEIENWTLKGNLIRATSETVVYPTHAEASCEIVFPQTGQYVIGVVGRGTPCRGVYPLVRVAIDGETLGTIPLGASQWHTRSTFGKVKKGRHRLSIAFVNDQNAVKPREDRNLEVDKVLVAFDAKPAEQVSFLTEPASTAVVRLGRGTVVVDQLRWDEVEPRNQRKADRYARALLAALGGDFGDFRPGTTIQCETMTPEPGLKHFRAGNQEMSLACNGAVRTTLRAAASGRYRLRLVAKGTSAANVFPVVEVRIDGKPVGQVRLASENWKTYPLSFDLAEGPRELAFAFINDANIDGQDRNLCLDRARIEKQ